MYQINMSFTLNLHVTHQTYFKKKRKQNLGKTQAHSGCCLENALWGPGKRIRRPDRGLLKAGRGERMMRPPFGRREGEDVDRSKTH